MWGTDIVGHIDPPTSRGHRFILAATNYFTKWTEVVPLKEVKAYDVVKFFKTHIFYWFSTSQRIVSDNGTTFKSSKVYALAEQFNIDWRFSSIYNPRANSLAEAFNKTLINIMKKTVDGNQRDWDNRLQEALWAYRTMYRMPTQVTPYSLTFGVEAILPLEVELPSLRVAMQNNMTMDECQQLRLDELDAMDEKRLIAQQKLEIYQAKMVRAYDKMARGRTFQQGEFVLVLKRSINGRHIGPKFSLNWEGSYVIEKVYGGGAYQLIDHECERPMPLINGRYLKKYYTEPRIRFRRSSNSINK
jgi:Integrase core domain